MNRIALPALCTLAILIGSSRAEEPSLSLEATVAKKVESLRAKTGAPAIALRVTRHGKVVLQMARGDRVKGSGVAATLDDLWHLGSITKSMTATLVGRLVESGAIEWDLTVGDALGEVVEKIHPNYRDATLVELLHHRSGLPANPPLQTMASLAEAETDPRPNRLAAVREILVMEPLGPRGTTFEYSNSGYIVVGAMLEARLRMAWEDLIRAQVFGPLEMKSAGFGPAGTIDVVDQPRGHRPRLLGIGHVPIPPDPRADGPQFIGPAGRVHGSLADLSAYAHGHITGKTRTGKPFLSQKTLSRLHTPPTVMGEDPEPTYAMGWVASPPGRLPTGLWHNGSNTLNYAELFVDPKSGFTLAFVSNSHRRDDLGPEFNALAKFILESLSH